jgi:hypothetical protein
VLGVESDGDLCILADDVRDVVGEQGKAGNHGRGGRVELHLVDSITAMLLAEEDNADEDADISEMDGKWRCGGEVD